MTIYYVALAILLLLLLAGGLFIQRALQERQAQRHQLIVALRARRNNFCDLSDSLPKGFLNQELSQLLYQAIIETCEHLSRLEPKEPQHREILAEYHSRQTQAPGASPERSRLGNPAQMREARHLLQELLGYVQQRAQANHLSQAQALAYSQQIKQLAMQITLDNHIFNAKQAQQIGKPRLAIHHYGLAKKLLTSNKNAQSFAKQITQLDSHIQRLQEQNQQTPDENTNTQWDQFADEDWKKKQLYD